MSQRDDMQHSGKKPVRRRKSAGSETGSSGKRQKDGEEESFLPVCKGENAYVRNMTV